MIPSPVPRPARLPAWAIPFSRSSLTAASMSPPVSSSARLQSIMPAWVISRSCFTSAAVGLYVTSLILCLAWGRLLRGRPRGRLLGRLCGSFAIDLGLAGRRLAFGSLALGGLAVLRDEVRHLDAAVSAHGDAVGQHPHDERRRSDGVIVPRDDEVGVVGVAVRVDEAD